MLNDWSGVDVVRPAPRAAVWGRRAHAPQPRATTFVERCFGYDGGIGMRPGLESHGGSTFCGLASLWLMGTLDEALQRRQGGRGATLRWLAARQEGGYTGRPHKPPDTCYSFWVGVGALCLPPQRRAPP